MEHLADMAVYSRRVTDLFDAPQHAGRPEGATLAGEAASKSRGNRVQIYLRTRDGAVHVAGFEALGCPHTIAAAELVCEDLQGRALAELVRYDARFVDAALPLPADKLDIRILIEDAVRAATAGDR